MSKKLIKLKCVAITVSGDIIFHANTIQIVFCNTETKLFWEYLLEKTTQYLEQKTQYTIRIGFCISKDNDSMTCSICTDAVDTSSLLFNFC